MAIGVAGPVGTEVAKEFRHYWCYSYGFDITSLVIPFAICNGFGRPIFGALVDKLGARNTALVSFVLIFLASVMMFGSPSLTMYTIAFMVLWGCLGGWLAIAPATTGAYFGMKDYARNYGVIFTAYGVGAIIGNVMSSRMVDITGSYFGAFPIVAGMAILGTHHRLRDDEASSAAKSLI